MEQKMSALEGKLSILRSSFGNKSFFRVDDAREALEIKKSTLYWDLHTMVEKGYLTRVGRGKFTFSRNVQEDNPLSSILAMKINKLLQETEFEYYISGLDVLLKYMHHIPDHYPVMLFVDKYSKEEIGFILRQNGILAVNGDNIKGTDIFSELGIVDNGVILHETSNFEYSGEGFAVGEKAFVDLYIEVTRRNFPLSLQELARIYENMEYKGVIDKKILIQVAYSRSVHYDIRFIAESKNINKAAFKMVRMIRGGEYDE